MRGGSLHSLKTHLSEEGGPSAIKAKNSKNSVREFDSRGEGRRWRTRPPQRHHKFRPQKMYAGTGLCGCTNSEGFPHRESPSLDRIPQMTIHHRSNSGALTGREPRATDVRKINSLCFQPAPRQIRTPPWSAFAVVVPRLRCRLPRG